jgi:Tol biopolymer transport system component/DNA-binding winged helix-turn-helix (wHTH) protein
MISPESGGNQISFFSRGFMALPFNQLYEFGEFRLDTGEKILTCGDSPVELTPKGFELLCVFVENHGRLLQKDELMEKIWADSFVEDSNLTFNIRQLRKILGDDAHDPKYIKTVRRHGYRFIADVRQISEENKRRRETPEPLFYQADMSAAAGILAARAKTKKSFSPLLLASFILLVAAVIFGAWYVKNKSLRPFAPVLAAPLASEKLSTNGKVVLGALTPDGNNVIYTQGTITDKQSVWLRHLEDGSSVEIIPPSDELYYGLALSPDGNTLYFTRRARQTSEGMSLYRVSIFGGIPQKITSGTQGWISVSPDGTRISFVRCPYGDDEFCSLCIADSADGKNERKIVSRPRPFRIGDNRISPDGKTIAFAVGQSANAANEFELAEVDLESGTERKLTDEKFFNIKYLTWLPDKSGLLMSAAKVPNKNYRIWQVSAGSGEALPLTKDSESYSVLGMDKNATKVVSTQVKQDFRVRLLSLENPSASRVLADGSTAVFAPDGKIYFTSIMSGNDEIWSINPDGSGQRQLTNNPADEGLPVVSPDGNSVYFVSNKTGAAQVWRMNADGSNQTQLTEKEGGAPFFVSPDGEWVYYRHALSSKLWRVSAKGGGEHLVFDKVKYRYSFSADGSQIAYAEKQGDERILTISELADGQIIKTFRLADPKALLHSIVWMPDRKHLAYITSDRELENNILWFQALDGGAPQKIADLGNEELGGFGLSVSPDGKTFAITQGKWLHDAVLFKGLR